MKHLSYEFPCEAGQRWEVRPISFRTFFNECKIVSIPLFQRKYCWTEDQIKCWFYDLTNPHPRFTSGRGHSVGKIMFKRNKVVTSTAPDSPADSVSDGITSDCADLASEELICIDGQQRITTTLLSLAALRDNVMTFVAENLVVTSSESLSPQQVYASNRLKNLVHDVDAVLFSNTELLTSWTSNVVTELASTAINTAATAADVTPIELFDSNGAPALNLESHLPVGNSLMFSRLMPSYLDRVPFFEILLVNKLNAMLKERLAPSLASSSTPSIAVRAATTHSVQYKVKSQFDRLIATDSSRMNSLKEKADRFIVLFNKILDHFQFVYMEFLNDDILLPQLFLWLQEKSIFSMGALLYNPTPGIKFRAVDLVRNLVMSELIGSECISSAECIYRENWIQPLEQHFALKGSAAMDLFLEAFGEYVTQCLRALKRSGNSNLLATLQEETSSAAPTATTAVDETAASHGCLASCLPGPVGAQAQLRNKASPQYGESEDDEEDSSHRREAGAGASPSIRRPTVQFDVTNPPPHFLHYYSALPSSFEQTLNDIIVKFGKAFNAQENKGVFLYARLYSLYENLRRHFDEVKASPDKSTAGTTEGFQSDRSKQSGYLAAKLLLRDLALFREQHYQPCL
jgi:hypothetical protein